MNICSAAWVKLPASASATKYRRCRNSIASGAPATAPGTPAAAMGGAAASGGAPAAPGSVTGSACACFM
jgi:hypothetical protein